MQMFIRKIRLFFVSYGRLLFIIIGSIIIFIYILKSINMYYKGTYLKNELTEEEKSFVKQQKQDERLDKNYISKFIENCNTGKIQEAYNMLTEECKKEKYKTLNEFKNKYIDLLFNIKICEYTIEKEDDTYIVYLTEDMLITGKTKSSKQTKLKIDAEKKINIIDEM